MDRKEVKMGERLRTGEEYALKIRDSGVPKHME